MPKTRVYNSAITISASDWLSLEPDPGTYALGPVGKAAVTLKNRSDMPGSFPMTKPKKGYLDKVEGHLERLSSTQTGRELMNTLIATNHVCTIKTPTKPVTEMSRNGGVSISQTQANFDDAFVQVVKHLRQGNAGAARVELAASIDAAGQMGFHANELATVILQRVNSYNGQQCLNGVAGAPVAITPRFVNVAPADITTMRNGPGALVDNQGLRYLLLALERFLKSGTGTDTTIVFDPWAYGDGNLARPPYVSLGHELLHALDAMRGTRIFDNEPEEECIYIPCGSFGQIACGGPSRKFTENVLRTALGKPSRTLI